MAAISPKLRVTPSTARVGDKLVVKATGVGNPTSSFYQTNQTGANNAILFTANDFFSGNNGTMPSITLTLGATSTANTTIPAGATGVTGHDVNVNLATDGSQAVIATANDVINAVNGDSRANQILTAALGGTALGNGTVLALAKQSLAGGANANVTGPSSVVIQHESGAGDVVTETFPSISLEGVVTAVGDFTYEVSREGFIKVQLLNSTGAISDTQRIQIFSH